MKTLKGIFIFNSASITKTVGILGLSLALAACGKSVQKDVAPLGNASSTNNSVDNTLASPPIDNLSVAITSPSSGYVVNQSNQSAYALTGLCSEEGRNVDIYVSNIFVQSVVCTSQAFGATLDLINLLDGPLSISVKHSNVSGLVATDQVNGAKVTLLPLVTIDPSGFGNTPSASLAPRTINLGGFDVITYKAVAVQSPDCSTVNFSSVVAAPIGTPFTFTPGNNASTIICAIGFDGFGNVQAIPTVSPALTIDTRGLVLTITSLASGFSVTPANESNINVAGACSEEGVAVLIRAGVLAASPICTNGAYSASMNFTSLADGAISIVASHTNGIATATASVAGIKATTAPVVVINSTGLGATPSNSKLPRTLTLSGANVVAYKAIAVVGTSCVGANFSSVSEAAIAAGFTFTPAEGNNIVCAIGRDQYQNWQVIPSTSSILVIDTIAPTITITTPVTGYVLTPSSPNPTIVSGACSENGQPVSIVAGTITANTTCVNGIYTGSIPLNTLPDGPISITVTIKDPAGNPGTAVDVITKKTSTPTVSIVAPVANSYITPSNQSAIVVSGACSEVGQPVKVSSGSISGSINCSSSNTYSVSLNLTGLSDGSQTITAIHSNTSGTQATASVVVLKDTTKPVVTITTPAANFTVTSSNQSSFIISGSCSEKGLPVSVSVVGNTTVSGSSVCNSGSYSVTVSLTAINAGGLIITASQTDAAGNKGSATVSGNKSNLSCDSFGGPTPPATENGLAGYLSYLTTNVRPSSPILADFWTQNPSDVNSPEILQPTQQATATDYLITTVNLPLQYYTLGFPANGTAASSITYPGTSNIIQTNFSLHMRSRLEAGAADAPAGNYYFAAIVDDMVNVKIQVNGQWQSLMTLDGGNNNVMACQAAGTPVVLPANGDLPIQITYAQGPASYLGVQLLWKKLPDSGPFPSTVDPLCGEAGNFFDGTTKPSTPQVDYKSLQSRGWTPVPADAYFLPQDILDRCGH